MKYLENIKTVILHVKGINQALEDLQSPIRLDGKIIDKISSCFMKDERLGEEGFKEYIEYFRNHSDIVKILQKAGEYEGEYVCSAVELSLWGLSIEKQEKMEEKEMVKIRESYGDALLEAVYGDIKIEDYFMLVKRMLGDYKLSIAA